MRSTIEVQLIESIYYLISQNLVVKVEFKLVCSFEQKDENDKVISRELNPQYVEFQNEFNALLSEDKEIEYTPLTMEDLEKVGETTDDYNLLFMLVQKPNE